MVTAHKLICARAARHEFAKAYQRAINIFRTMRLTSTVACHVLQKLLPEFLPLRCLRAISHPEVADFAWDSTVVCDNGGDLEPDKRFRLMARKRPLQQHEIDNEEYDSVSVEGKNHSVVVHDGRVHRDGRTLYMVHSRFCLDRVFGDADDNKVIYEDAARPLLARAKAGERASLLFFGQTGTGKTYTTWGVLDLLAKDLFASSMNGRKISVLSYELRGEIGGKEGFFDLLGSGAKVKALQGEDRKVHIRGARVVECQTEDELREALREAHSWRCSESTERNEASSRSHAVVEIRIGNPHGPSKSTDGVADTDEAASSEGVLKICDLAGSERNFETQQHTRKMAQRGGAINFSLLQLKECARIMHLNMKARLDGEKEVHVPFRRSKLTHLLEEAFTDPEHRACIVATLSPTPTDVEHSLNTLQHVAMMHAGVRHALKTRRTGFDQLDGRGHGLHSKLQDARKGQMNLHAFNMVTDVGGTIMKRYEKENVKTEAFIDPRWHREMNVCVDEDLWVMREADAEVVEGLNSWRVEQWDKSKAQDVSRWDAVQVQAFIKGLQLPGATRIPSTMTGSMLLRLGRRGLLSICEDTATAEALHEALGKERTTASDLSSQLRDKNFVMAGIGHNKAHVVVHPRKPGYPQSGVGSATEVEADASKASSDPVEPASTIQTLQCQSSLGNA